MAEPLDLIPIRQENIDSIRARLNADVNAGLTPSDDGYLDLTPGGFWWDNTQAVALEMERLWDVATHELPAAIFVLYSYGEYLDDHGASLGIERKSDAEAVGVVRFTGTDGTIVTVGTQVAAPTTDPDADPQTYEATAGGTVVGGYVDLPVQAIEAGVAGNTPALSVTLLMTPVSGITAVTNQVAISGGADVEEDDTYRDRLMLEMRGQGGGGTQSQLIRWALAIPGIGAATVQPLVAGPGTARVMVRDSQNNPVSFPKVEEVQADIDPPAATTLTNAPGSVILPLGGAAYPVNDTTAFRASGRFYVRGQIVTYTGKTPTTFTGCIGGTGTIPDDTPVYQGGVGLGKASIGHDIVIGTPSALNITVVATVVFEQGFSHDGAGGTVALREDLIAAVSDYVDNLDVGEDVVLNAVEARIMRLRGVYDVTGTQINAVAANKAVGADEVAQSFAVTLS